MNRQSIRPYSVKSSRTWSVKIRDVLFLVAADGRSGECLVAPHGMVLIERVFGMVPVEKRIVESDLEAFRTHGLDGGAG